MSDTELSVGGTIAWLVAAALMLLAAAGVLVTGRMVLTLTLFLAAGIIVALGCLFERGVRAIFQVALLWWSLDNVQLLASTAFPFAGTLAALAAVNFFYFVPDIPSPSVANAFYVDSSRFPPYFTDNAVWIVVTHVANMTKEDDLRSTVSSYNQIQALSQDCAVAKEVVTLLIGNACDGPTGLDAPYPEYLHDLFASQHPTTEVAPSYIQVLSPTQLQLAAADLRAAAVSVDAVTVINNGHVDATSVQLVAPAGVQPLEPDQDRVQFDLPAGKPRVILFRQSAAGLTSGTSIPLAGFYIGSDIGDSLISQQFALNILFVTGIFFLLVVGFDMFRTRAHPGERPVKRH